MSFRGRGSATGANRGGFGNRGGMRHFPLFCEVMIVRRKLTKFFLDAGRGGFQPSFGPPAQVLGMYTSN
jgi:hypothetical protein